MKKVMTNGALWAVAAAGAGWAAWLWFWPMGLVAAVPLVAVAGLRGKRPALAAAGLSPFVLVPAMGFVGGMTDYMRGQASLVYAGLETAESNNLHASYRVPMARTGRPDDGREGLYRVARNAAVHTMCGLFGPSSRAYLGHYPARDAAWALLEHAAGAHLVGSQLRLHENYRDVNIGPLAEVLARHPDSDLRATFAGETLVVGVPNELWLVDVSQGRPFTRWIRKDLRTYWPGDEPSPAVVETRTP